MKKFWLLIAAVFSMSFYAQDQAADTTQVVYSGRVNTVEAEQAPYVIYISSDGFRYDYMTKYNADNLQKFASEGVWAKDGMYPSFPSITFPNHYSLVTGLYPSHHGIVDNRFYDPRWKEFYSMRGKPVVEGKWYGGTPLWDLAETQGMRAASLFWVGSESDAGGVRPTYYYHYNEAFNGKGKANIIKHWLELPEDIRPHFITLYFPEVDHMGHRYGPDAPQTKEAVEFINQSIQTLVDELQPLNLPINYIFVSDHGMIAVPEKNYIKMPKIDEDKYIVVNSGVICHIYAKQPEDIMTLYIKLTKKKQENYRIYLAKDVPAALHYSSADDKTGRIGDIILIPNDSKSLVSKGKTPPVGQHGFDPHVVPEMKATFIAWGPAFNQGQIIPSFENINIYPIIAKILKLKINTPIDGNIEVLDGILKK